MTSEKPIIAIGPNPAWQKTLFFEKFKFGEVNRADKMTSFASGKGINFCRAAANWNKFPTLLMQFAGGDTGKKLCRRLDAERMLHHTVEIQAATRTCTTCLCRESQQMTEVIEPSAPLSEQNVDDFLAALQKNIATCAGVAICGTLPDKSSNRLYVETAKLARANNTPLLIDACQKIKPALTVGGNMTLKVNAEEIRLIAGMDDTIAAIKATLAAYPLRTIAVTDGANNAYLASGSKLWTLRLPRLEKIINPLGSGDTAAAVFCNELLAATAPEQAFAAGLAAASANCLTAMCGNFNRTEAEKLMAKIIITPGS